MKSLILFTLLLIFKLTSTAQIDCDDATKIACCHPTSENPIPTIDKVKCAEDKGYLYPFFPQLLFYKNYKFLDITHCNDKGLDVSRAQMVFEYCLPNTRNRMSVSIINLKDPFFTSNAGKAIKDMYLLPFEQPAASLIFGYLPALNIDKFTQNKIASLRFAGGKSDDVSFVGWHNNQYLINISLTDPEYRFKKTIDVENYLKEYILQMNF